MDIGQPLGRILGALDLRFADPKVEAHYRSYYAQVKRNLLPTAIQVVLLVDLLQLFATCLHGYLITKPNRWLFIAVTFQIIILIVAFAMLRLVRGELANPTSVGQQESRFETRRQINISPDLNQSEGLALTTLLSTQVDENNNTTIKTIPNQANESNDYDEKYQAKWRLILPYALWLCQLIQLSCGLAPQQSFINYATLLLYTYSIYVIYPIRLMSCILLAIGLSLSQPLAEYLLFTGYRSFPYQHQGDISGETNDRSNISLLDPILILTLGINIIGIMSFFFYERQQRAAFLETNQSLETKLTLERESKEQERLLLSILPYHLAGEIRKDLGKVATKQFKKIYMSRHENVSILFADIVGFTAISSKCPAPELVKILNELFARFDKLAEKYHQLRIKILGDCYYAISGAPVKRSDHAVLCVHMGLSMVEAIKSVRERTKSTVDMRVGIHTGAILAGVLGQRQWQFDVYSRDVELANKMESSGLPGRVHISDTTLRFLNDEFEVSEAHGETREEALKMANIKTYFIDSVKKPYPEGTNDAMRPRINSNLEQDLEVDQLKLPMTNQIDKQSSSSRIEEQPLTSNSTNGRSAEASDSKDRNDSFYLDEQIKQFTLNFSDQKFERQFRSTSDVASCVSLVGLPITLLCAFVAYTHLYKTRTEVTVIYASNIFILFSAVLLCVLPYYFRRQSSNNQNWIGHQQTKCLSKSVMKLADSIGKKAWMKLALSSLMTLIWLSAHLVAVRQTSSYIYQLTSSKAIQLSTVDLFNYFAIACSLAVTAITRVSFLVKTIIIFIVIFLQVILNVTLLSNIISERLVLMQAKHLNTPILNQPGNPFFVDSYHYDQYIFTLTLFTICWALFLMNRQFELTNRRLFLWRKQVESRKEEVADLRQKNEALVYNILPPNVAKIFLGKRTINDEELYSKSYEAVGVLFAAMPNFSDFYSEESVNQQGLECLRFLNEVISDYDALLDDTRFKNIIKIKTMGSTYMAASGLYEGDANGDALAKGQKSIVNDPNSVEEIKRKWGHLEQLTEFALALKRTLNGINKESFNNFVLRIGINQGPITAGVIGVKKPHFDMWGNTVNVASRMESTGIAGSIQVVEETANILRHFGFIFEQRGFVSVKGKGKLMTFCLTGRKESAS